MSMSVCVCVCVLVSVCLCVCLCLCLCLSLCVCVSVCDMSGDGGPAKRERECVWGGEALVCLIVSILKGACVCETERERVWVSGVSCCVVLCLVCACV